VLLLVRPSRKNRLGDFSGLTSVSACPSEVRCLSSSSRRIETVDVVELLTLRRSPKAARCASSNPSCPKAPGTSRSAPSYFEWTQKTGGITTVAGHRVEPISDGRARLTLSLDMRGLLIPVVAVFFIGLTNRYMNLEAEGMKRAAETAGGQRIG